MWSFRKKNKKLVIIGLDGVSFELIRDLSERSIMPNLNKIFKTGKLVKMSVSIPEISAVSWSSFMTGTDAGNHGIFGFTDLIRGSYDLKFPDFSDLKAIPFFDSLGLKEIRSVIINLPSTYPVRPIPGVLISGFISIDLKKSVFPLMYLSILEQKGYQVDVDAGKGKDQKVEFLSDLHRNLRTRREVSDFFWEKEKWDLFMLTISGTDRLHHFLYDAYIAEDHRFHREFFQYYEEVDRVIGDLFSRIEGKEGFELIILSDHGSGLIKKEVYVNPILRNTGFFSMTKSKKLSLSSITKESKAFAIDPSRIFIHLKEKFPSGNVDKNDYEKVRNEIKKMFEEYEIEGEKIIKRVFFKEEIYSNRFIDAAPDLVLLSNHGYDLKGGLKKNEEYGRSHFTGMHFQDNAFFFSTDSEVIPEKMTIFDVKDIIFKLLKVSKNVNFIDG